MRAKINQACRLLTNGQAILPTALDLGFSSSQYFAVAFRRYMGVSPKEYREQSDEK
jgi:AraC-like DNA-binding protein